MSTPRPEPHQKIPREARCVFKGVLFDVYQWEQPMFDGSMATFERLKRPDTVVVIPVLPDGRILLAKQEQPGGGAPYMSGLGGRMEEGEEPEAAARRELREESGYEARSLALWDAQQPVGKLDWAVYTFIAKGLSKVGEQALDPGEKIELMPVTLDGFIEMGTGMYFAEKEIVGRLIEAKYDAGKREELRKLFSPEA